MNAFRTSSHFSWASPSCSRLKWPAPSHPSSHHSSRSWNYSNVSIASRQDVPWLKSITKMKANNPENSRGSNNEVMQKSTLEWRLWLNIVVNFQKWKHQMKLHTSKCHFYSHLSDPFRWSTIFTVLLSKSPALRGLVEGCAVRWGCRDGLQGLPLSGFPDFPPSVESEHRIVCRLAWQDAFCPTMVADSWTPAVLALRWGMGLG